MVPCQPVAIRRLRLLVRQVLLLAWKTGAKRMGFFTRAEFRRGDCPLRGAHLRPSHGGMCTGLPRLRRTTDVVIHCCAEYVL